MDLEKEFAKVFQKIDELKSMLLAKESVKSEQLPDFLTIKEVAQITKRTEQTIYTHRKQGLLRALASEGKVLFAKEEVLRYINAGNQFAKPKKKSKNQEKK